MNAQEFSLTVTTASDGSATAYFPSASTSPAQLSVSGRLVTIRYVKTNYSDGVDFTFTKERSGQTVMVGTNVNATADFAPGQDTHDDAGAEVTGVKDYFVFSNDRLKLVIAAGGNAATGTFYVTFA